MIITPITSQNNNSVNFNGFNITKPIAKGYDKFTTSLATGMGKIIDSKSVQSFANKYHNTNIATHIFSATGVLLSSFLVFSIAKNKNIEEKRKKPLMLNTAISCAIGTTGGYCFDKLLDKPIQKFADTFVQVNKSSPKLHKYLEGIKIAKSALIFGLIYRFIVPVISMVLAEKVIEKKN